MITLDQVYLLEQKVESAVAKIQQLQAENDALRSKCLELTNALSSKSEQLSSFESDQNQIEDGIKKALDRLDSIENTVLNSKPQVPSSFNQPKQSVPLTDSVSNQVPSFDMMDEAPAPEQNQSETEEPVISESDNLPEDFSLESEPFEEQSFSEDEEIAIEKSFETTVSSEPEEEYIPDDNYADDETQDGLGFDIF